jgi:hypothetical protein
MLLQYQVHKLSTYIGPIVICKPQLTTEAIELCQRFNLSYIPEHAIKIFLSMCALDIFVINSYTLYSSCSC